VHSWRTRESFDENAFLSWTLNLRDYTRYLLSDGLRKDGAVPTIEQEIEALAKTKWPQAGRIDVGSKLSHAWHGDLVQPMTGFSILVCCRKGKLITQLKANTLEALKRKVLATASIDG
jgi:hypothetical protein